MVRQSPSRKIRHSLWRKLLRRRRRVHAMPAQVSQRRKLAQDPSKLKRKRSGKAKKRISARELRTRNQRAQQPVPLYVHISRCSIVLFGTAAIGGTVMSIIKPPVPLVAASKAINSPMPSAKPTPKDNAALKQSILTVLEKYSNFQLHLVVIDPDGGVVDIAGSKMLPAASTIKIPILVALFQQIDRGEIKLDEQLTLQRSMVAAGSGVLAKSPAGAKFSVQDVATKMITISDNTAANLLIDRLGGKDKLNLQFRSWGLLQTTVIMPLPDFEGKNVTSAQELATLLAGLKTDSKILSPNSQKAVLDILRQTKRNTMIPAGINDAKAQVAHKTGEISPMLADVGLVELPNGQSFTLAAMVLRPSDDQRAEVLIKQISQTVLQNITKKQPEQQ
jgi:beta-lactamase class A